MPARPRRAGPTSSWNWCAASRSPTTATRTISPPSERLDLFIQVCQAIQHAHQKGIIHRDIKPSNILVTLHDGVPVPKVIDFGIAKATGAAADRQDAVHRVRAVHRHAGLHEPGAGGDERAGHRHAQRHLRLGVLLYELLTGQTPFDHEGTAGGGLGRDAPDHPREGTAAALDAPEHAGRQPSRPPWPGDVMPSRRN